MRRVIFILLVGFGMNGFMYAGSSVGIESAAPAASIAGDEVTPHYLYKILSANDWEESSALQSVKLTDADGEFIHFSKEDQLDRIISKYWAHVPKFVVLKIDTTQLPGKLVFETNPGGTAKYYHLYNGFIPLDAVESVEVKTAVTDK